jgi:hypothetical protein
LYDIRTLRRLMFRCLTVSLFHCFTVSLLMEMPCYEELELAPRWKNPVEGRGIESSRGVFR